MKRSELSEFEFEENGFKIKIKRGPSGQPIFTTAPITSLPATLSQASSETLNTIKPAGQSNDHGSDEAGYTYLKSPMVGTFYRSPSPETPPFIDANAKVEEKTVVCIIEAMKIMNEIQAETKGTVVEILVESGQPVEYGQRLFKIKQG